MVIMADFINNHGDAGVSATIQGHASCKDRE